MRILEAYLDCYMVGALTDYLGLPEADARRAIRTIALDRADAVRSKKHAKTLIAIASNKNPQKLLNTTWDALKPEFDKLEVEI